MKFKTILKFIILGMLIVDVKIGVHDYKNSILAAANISHKCENDKWTLIEDPTCTQEGVLQKNCKICGKPIDHATCLTLPHTYQKDEWLTTEEPNCISKGRKIQFCTVCSKIMNKKDIKELGHDYKNCICTKCGSETTVDENSKTLILTDTIYEALNLPTSGSIVIPETVTYENNTYTVVGIGYALFYENKDITSVTLPPTIKYIEEHAFDFCENMQTCNLPEGLLSIGEAAFQCCFKLESVTLPSTLQSIGNFAYNHCSSLNNTSIQIPDSIELLGTFKQCPAHMFYDCGTENFTEFTVNNNPNGYTVNDGILYARDEQTLVSIPRGKTFDNNTYIMPDTVTNLGELSFSRNPNIHTVVISDNLIITGEMSREERWSYNNIGNQLSVACYVYADVYEYAVKDSNTHYSSIDGILYTKDMSTLVAIPNKYQGEINIPEGVTSWQHEALWTSIHDFENLAFNTITTVNIPASMTQIDEYQIETLNDIHDLYGTSLHVSENNPSYMINASGHLTAR